MKFARLIGIAFLGAFGTSVGLAQVTVFDFDAVAFVAAGGAPITCDFDSVADGAPFEGGSVAGATFHGLGSSLFVVQGNSTFTPGDTAGINKLFPTSGANVLSPGGRELGFTETLQLDSVEITFANPTTSFGFDLLYQSNDFSPSETIELYNAGNVLIYQSALLTTSSQNGGAPGGAVFHGYMDPLGIARVIIRDNDNDANFPDANIGYDSLRYQAVPEPASICALGMGILAVLRRRLKSGK